MELHPKPILTKSWTLVQIRLAAVQIVPCIKAKEDLKPNFGPYGPMEKQRLEESEERRGEERRGEERRREERREEKRTGEKRREVDSLKRRVRRHLAR